MNNSQIAQLLAENIRLREDVRDYNRKLKENERLIQYLEMALDDENITKEIKDGVNDKPEHMDMTIRQFIQRYKGGDSLLV